VANEWYCEVAGRTYGPLGDQELMRMAGAGKLAPTDRVRLGKQGAWAQAASVRGLAFRSSATPPPLPPAAGVASQGQPVLAALRCPKCGGEKIALKPWTVSRLFAITFGACIISFAVMGLIIIAFVFAFPNALAGGNVDVIDRRSGRVIEHDVPSSGPAIIALVVGGVPVLLSFPVAVTVLTLTFRLPLEPRCETCQNAWSGRYGWPLLSGYSFIHVTKVILKSQLDIGKNKENVLVIRGRKNLLVICGAVILACLLLLAGVLVPFIMYGMNGPRHRGDDRRGKGAVVAKFSGLLEQLQSPEKQTRIRAAEALGEIDLQAVKAAIAAIRADPSRQMDAGVDLVDLGPEPRETALVALAPLLRDKDKEVCSAAAEAVRKIGPVAQGTVQRLVVQRLMQLRDSADPSLRARADEALRKIDPEFVPKD
jgi:hypothetical protein